MEPRIDEETLDALATTLRTIADRLSPEEELDERPVHLCRHMRCSRERELESAIRETIAVLEVSKSSFHSKALGKIRRKLESLVAG